jgi:hypothetical protein
MKWLSSKPSKFMAEAEMVLVALLYGLSYIPIREAMESGEIHPFIYCTCKFITELMFMIFAKVISSAVNATNEEVTNANTGREGTEEASRLLPTLDSAPATFSQNSWFSQNTKDLFFWGTINGLIYLSATTFMLIGMETVEAGESALIIGMNLIIVPIGMINYFCFVLLLLVTNT